ncbi:MAG TPA: hypothetical protein VFW31_06335 [Candidatus Angelobacter sp.]|nr:hypothetical protein [Candidatus Angelobacter sp.]
MRSRSLATSFADLLPNFGGKGASFATLADYDQVGFNEQRGLLP